ncbi:Phosphoribosylaminoimidazole-succinocarboxamide synthase [Piscirickettsia salmonis]|uniref:Phosphoribosylaminoimidazole-succinocarboxamide synthase n=1 Tax=Piscirickettsia salmonis TaxID=1238 RepID=A0A1L6TBB0_PISSA|nr:phosphoribosylaminoimidazolesuccinocarboxamide synthase [Piscirickettsia salmonis]AKP73668.1 phosphoribosylaminoimidazolesuccinocarboxamide synthase [Piscirickettsia salmonis LF-89 = ATCC VR-1361]ALB22457.1 phosphoribosylaminoimidazolesuccinocarboxamide synthase [Piscirickettsia salmonis]ALY02520.1 phosphoribosylaminoimidazolesuccinocarboxamide synthase [Piscirickettsia salmonis]AMA42041.1 phosphoribosylaminoimidazolesuccinocarboxamide synthase [Piscirickettsia salmonis]AOS34509.1 phosphori
MQKKSLLYSGKVKSVYQTDDPQCLVMEFRDDATAFNGVKHELLENKGKVSNIFNAFIMQKLESAGVKTHFIEKISDHESLVKPLEMLRVECVVRNIAAGSLSKRYGIEEGSELKAPIFEFFLKDDDLGDPMINDEHIIAFGWGTEEDIKMMRELTIKVNHVLNDLFLQGDILLVDYKLEFGYNKGELLLGDEFTPDNCRLWDAKTREKMDKDRFRRDLGGVVESYIEVGRRIGISSL